MSSARFTAALSKSQAKGLDRRRPAQLLPRQMLVSSRISCRPYGPVFRRPLSSMSARPPHAAAVQNAQAEATAAIERRNRELSRTISCVPVVPNRLPEKVELRGRLGRYWERQVALIMQFRLQRHCAGPGCPVFFTFADHGGLLKHDECAREVAKVGMLIGFEQAAAIGYYRRCHDDLQQVSRMYGVPTGDLYKYLRRTQISAVDRMQVLRVTRSQ